MIDPILSLSMSIYSNKGVYALLLGSGISRSSGIPTGWEIVLDLISKLSYLKNKDYCTDPLEWYKNEFGEDADYSKLLKELGKSPSERQQLLRAYFEPNNEEREKKLKMPSPAHKAIAKLISAGYIRIVITTNFDRLIEKALEEIGINPTVISTPYSIKGAPPISHSKCTIVKVNGDYLDTRIKNTTGELQKYSQGMNQLLDRIFDEYGLIICGWSAEWDIALRSALEHCQNRRYTSYWTSRRETEAYAKKIINLRRAKVIKIKDADSFFSELSEKVLSLEDIDKSHPLSPDVAIATLKRYIVDDRFKISLYDLMNREIESLYTKLSDNIFSMTEPVPEIDSLRLRVRRYEAISNTVLSLFINGCYWGEKKHNKIWVKSIERIANHNKEFSGWAVQLNLKLYPALLMLYGGGIASLFAEKYDTFVSILKKPTIMCNDGKEKPLCFNLTTLHVMDERVGWLLPNMERHHTPLSDYILEILRPYLNDFLPDEMQYKKLFDKFEYLLALIVADLTGNWGPPGAFVWRDRSRLENGVVDQTKKEVEAMGEEWPLFKLGVFGGSIDRFNKISKLLDEEFGKRFLR